MKKGSKIEEWPLWLHIGVTWGGAILIVLVILTYISMNGGY